MKKIALACTILTHAISLHCAIPVVPLIKIGAGTVLLGGSYKTAQEGNEWGKAATEVAQIDNPGAPAMALFPAMGAMALWGCSILSGALGGLLLLQGIQSFIK